VIDNLPTKLVTHNDVAGRIHRKWGTSTAESIRHFIGMPQEVNVAAADAAGESLN
jgi:hypothetical protein